MIDSSCASRSRRRGLFVLSLALVAVVAAPGRGRLAAQDPSKPSQEPAPAQAPPTFRVEAGFVRVDAYATKDGVAVRDLTANELQVLEDGVPQKIETFEHVEVRGAGPQETRREPNSVREGVAEAADPRNRVFVIFLDRYYVELAGSHRMQRAITNMLERIIAPGDLFAVMTPEMSAKDITLARRTTTIEAELSRYWYWGERDRLGAWDETEAQIEMCYGLFDDSPGVAQEMIARRREKRTLDALTDLAIYLRGIREERKAVIPITMGWLLHRENPGLTSSNRPPDVGQIGVGPDGRITTDSRAARNNRNLSRHECDVLRQQLAYIDNWQNYRDLMDLANRSNVSFYPVDPRGLAAIDTPVGPGRDLLPPHMEKRLVQERVENLRTLAQETDGLAVVDTNDLDRGIARIVDDLTSYYLIGYYTSNPELDGRYRRIEVRSTRPGVEIRHRRGYRAATAEEIEEAREMTAEATAEAPPSAVQAALNSLGAARPGLPLRTRVSFATMQNGSGGAVARLWALAELDAALAKTEEWSGGGEAEVQVAAADGTPLAQTTVALEPRARAVTAELPGVELPGGEIMIRIRLSPSAGGLPLTDTLRILVPADPAAPGAPRLLRRGPTTGLEYLATADQRFRRTERLRLELPMAEAAVASSAEILDRNGKALGIPVKTAMRADGPVHWAMAEVALAPLAAGDYAIRLTAEREQGRQEVVTGFRIVP